MSWSVVPLVLIFALMWPTKSLLQRKCPWRPGGRLATGKVRKVNSCKLTFGSLHCCFDLCVGVLIFPLLRLTTGKVRKVNSCDSYFGQNQSSVGIADKFNFRWKRVFRLWTTSLIIRQKKFATLSLAPQKYGPFTFLYFLGWGHLHICQYFYRYLRTTW